MEQIEQEKDIKIIENEEMVNIENNTNNINSIRVCHLADKYNIKFYHLCQLFESCIKAKSNTRIKLIKAFLEKYFKECNDLFPIFRLIFPKQDRNRASYGIKENYLGNHYSKILSLPDKEKQMLSHWKNPTYQPAGAPAGDFVGTLVYILKSRCKDVSNMTINEINDFLDELCVAVTTEEKTTCLAKYIQKASVLEQKWVTRCILKDSPIGIGHETVFKSLDSRAADVYNATSSLVEVCIFLNDPKKSKYANSFFKIFFPIKPMLAGRMSLNNIILNYANTPVYVETKYDGERIQCHVHETEVKFFTRNAVDYTYLYGPKLSEVIHKCVNAKSAILDGEIVVWDKIKGKFAPFGENKHTANSDELEKQLVYMIFDIIYLITPKGDEYPLTNVILSDRKEILKKIVNVVPKKLELVEGQQTSNVDEVLDFFSEAVNKGEEGVIIKKRDSTYKPDERSNDWIKMKSDYLDNLTDTLDLVIIGGYYGEGRRVTGVSYDWNDHINVFLLGVVKRIDKENPRNSVILPLVKVGTGYTQEELEIMRQRLKMNWRKYDSKMSPCIFGNWSPAQADRPDVYIDDPSESIVLECKGAELVPTDTFPAKVTLRFPRVVRVRYDKSWLEAMKYEDILKFYEDMHKNQVINNNKRKQEDLGPDDMLELDKEKKRKKGDQKFTKILDCFRDIDTNNISKISSIFQGLEFLILNQDDNSVTNMNRKKELECLIVEHGGNKVQNFLPTTTHVIASKLDIRAQNILKTRDVNIFNAKWVNDCVKNNKLISISPIYLIHTTDETRLKFSETIDKYNDNYLDDVNIDAVKEIFSGMKDYVNEQDYVFNLEEIKREFYGNEIMNKLVN